jgi:hypothetical protein
MFYGLIYKTIFGSCVFRVSTQMKHLEVSIEIKILSTLKQPMCVYAFMLTMLESQVGNSNPIYLRIRLFRLSHMVQKFGKVTWIILIGKFSRKNMKIRRMTHVKVHPLRTYHILSVEFGEFPMELSALKLTMGFE